jgi:hypothetical protein
MVMKVKWDVQGKGDEAWGGDMQGGYTGPIPPKGSYVARIKRMTLTKIKTPGENQGKPRLNILLEVVSGAGAESVDDSDYKYRGAPIWEGLNIIKSQTGKAQAFIHALTDGSKAQKDYIENVFWPPNMDIKADKETRRDGTEDIHIKKIGKYSINSPNGEMLVRIITKMGKDLESNPKAEVSQYLPYTGPRPQASKNGQVKDEEEGDLLEEVTDDDLVEEEPDDVVEAVDDDVPF